MDTVFRLCWVIYCQFIPIFFFFYVRLYCVIYCLFIPQFFSVRTITRCKFDSKPHASKGFISRFDHIFQGYSNRHLTFSTYQHCLSHSTCTMIAIGHISNIIELCYVINKIVFTSQEATVI